MYPQNLKYSKEHVWVLIEGGNAKIGITDYAQQQLGDIVLAELPKSGTKLVQGKSFGVVESVKSVSDLISPLNGEVMDTNGEVINHPELINKDPYGKGWMVIIKMDNPAEIDVLMSASDYEETLKK